MRTGLRAVGALRPEDQHADPVALETPVVATGARPGSAADKRELFTEETQTVLVFEKGAVIRLSAGVADGQLLFLTNKKTGKEVVTQVVRKRSFRPTSCYVDLEFTEACPGFWGIEFPKSAPSAPGQMAPAIAEEEADDSPKHAAAPDVAEVDRLKKEVSELQTQLKTLIATGQGVEQSAKAADAKAAADAAGEATGVKQVKQQPEEKALEQLLAQAAEQEKLPGPKRLVAYPQKTTSSVVKAASKVATVAAFATVLSAAAVAAYRFGLLDSWVKRPAAASASTSGPATAANPAPAQTKVAAGSAASSAPTATSLTASGASPGDASGVQGKGSEPLTPASGSKTSPNSTSAAASSSANTDETAHQEKRSSPPGGQGEVAMSSTPSTLRFAGGSSSSVTENTAATPADDYIAPKLVHAVRPVSPPDALRNYVTGNVNVDALVDATGHVKSVTVLSGPQKLHSTAVAQMKEYVYEPARKNGKPVPSHVQVSLQYWYEP